MTFDPAVWSRVPFHFWTVSLFALGCIVGSFLNVCIHRMPRGESIVSPPSHCPHCNYSIPWYLNIPLLTWVYLRGRCANCKAPISVRYFLVELLTGVAFVLCWLRFGHFSPILAVIYCFFIAALITATFIDFEHFIIPDEITLGGTVLGFILSFLIPLMHFDFSSGHVVHLTSPVEAMQHSLMGILVGAGVLYAILRLGKLFFGRQRFTLQPGTTIIFTENSIKWPDHEMEYGDIFYRPSDTIRFHAQRLEMIDRCYSNVDVSLKQDALQVGEDVFKPEEVLHLEGVTDELVLPREAMGLGDVKFMAAIGAFLGWPAVVFSLAVSSLIGSIVGISLILLRKREWSNRLPYGPYISMGVVIWMFFGIDWLAAWLRLVR